MRVLSRIGPTSTDADVARSLAGGDLEALALLYDRYGALAFSLAVRILGDQGLAEDVVQDSFLNVWNGAASFDSSRGSVRAWLCTVVRNRAIDVLRGRSSHGRREVDLGGAENVGDTTLDSDPWRRVSAAMERDAVRDALGTLPVEQRQAVELAYYGGYSQREIAQISNVPVSTVKGRMRLGLEKLHSYLAGKGVLGDR